VTPVQEKKIVYQVANSKGKKFEYKHQLNCIHSSALASITTSMTNWAIAQILH
jgi:hypothetical protein